MYIIINITVLLMLFCFSFPEKGAGLTLQEQTSIRVQQSCPGVLWALPRLGTNSKVLKYGFGSEFAPDHLISSLFYHRKSQFLGLSIVGNEN